MMTLEQAVANMTANMEAANAEYEKAYLEAQNALNSRATALSSNLQASNDLFAKALEEINKQLSDALSKPEPTSPVPPSPAVAPSK